MPQITLDWILLFHVNLGGEIVEIRLYFRKHSLSPMEFSMINQQKLIDTFCDKVSHFDPPEY